MITGYTYSLYDYSGPILYLHLIFMATAEPPLGTRLPSMPPPKWRSKPPRKPAPARSVNLAGGKIPHKSMEVSIGKSPN